MAPLGNLHNPLVNMENVLRWLARGVHNLHHLYGRGSDEEVRGTFEHIDSTRLDANDFRSSDSLGLHEVPTLDGADFRPPRLRKQLASRTRSAAARMGRGVAA
jgi:hypothetical protein